MKRKFLLLTVAMVPILVSACSLNSNDGNTLAKMTFNHVNAFPVYVASYEPVNINEGKTHLLPEGFVTDPAPLIFDYLSSRFEASGHQGKLRIEIKDVVIRHEVVSSDNDIGAMIGLGKKDHYNVKAYIDVILLGSGDVDKRMQSMIVSRNIYISEHLSLVEREKMQMQALDNMIDDLDIALRKVLKETFDIL